ncbi:MAG TPA: tetratricopeptide repeat protein [Candidatus Dormibacteraeota bacterium]|jgi:tetratricopeptide (TPR) repeat protein|nr:tetratricopeptide repeat protein [Candidatus Dormibacteraeota bacterium]
MRPQKLFARIAACSILFLSATVLASADTIVLKNGRKIVALSVTEEGDKIHYETSAGTLTLPKSIVDHIIKGVGGMPGSFAQAASDLAITPPALESIGIASAGNEIEQGAVHDGSIDRTFIAKLEGDARSGGKAAGDSAALAHHVAAQYEMAHGDMEHALSDERTALNFAPEQPVLLMNVAYLHLRRSEFKQSLEYLERARRVAPDNPDVSKLAGWAYYGLNKIDQAVAEWKRALALRADPEVQAALDKAAKDKQEEESYKENESAHFNLRYSGASEPALAREVLRTLEAHYGAIESELSFSTPDSIGVILYTQQAFSDITNAPNWVGALNDGRIRVPVQGLTSMTPELSRVLRHELTHSFVQQKTHGQAPTWLQEGLAQWMEGKRSGDNAAALVKIYDAKQGASLGQLEGSWMHFPGNTAGYAYAWALANVEAIVQTTGMGDIERVLEQIGAGQPTETALRNVLHSDYNDLMQSTAEYLRKNYVR